MMRRRWAAIAMACVFLAGCATGYGPKGMTGGYTDQWMDDPTYLVSFQGNGHTSGDTVWYYWIYRCAELTRQKGYTAFTLTPVDKKTSLLLQPEHQAHAEDAQDAPGQSGPQFVKAKGGGGGGYYYVPGGSYTITTWSSKAIVTMYKEPYPAEARFLLDPEKILTPLKPYVESRVNVKPPARIDLLRGALIVPLPAPT